MACKRNYEFDNMLNTFRFSLCRVIMTKRITLLFFSTSKNAHVSKNLDLISKVSKITKNIKPKPQGDFPPVSTSPSREDWIYCPEPETKREVLNWLKYFFHAIAVICTLNYDLRSQMVPMSLH